MHRVNVASVCERLAEPRASIAYCKTDEQRANGFTKIVSPQEWPATLEQMGILPNLAAASASAVAAQPADLASSQPAVEAIAGSLPHRLSEEHILRLLGHLPNDGAVRGPSNSEVHCFTVGGYCHGGGIVGIRNNTHRFCSSSLCPTSFQKPSVRVISGSVYIAPQRCVERTRILQPRDTSHEGHLWRNLD